ncbi:MAG: T9SS type A sorting domain-containing protein [Bacteroidetes bacterium]|jgi:hypothetical protein|nr:T9SS type A sorting domain-containing protein [Bacteroidota bacterium]
MKTIPFLSCLLMLVFGLCTFQESAIFAQKLKNEKHRCGTMEMLDRLVEADPAYQQRLLEMKRVSHNQSRLKSTDQGETITIPVVVHVIYFNEQENISQEQILSQITVINEDFQKLNADTANVPAAFTPLIGNANIQFCLARTDPDGNPTTGITRTQTTLASFNFDNAMKFEDSGGHDAWNTNKYLNIWVCPLTELLGYAQFPEGPANTDGIVVTTDAFGSSDYDDGSFYLSEFYDKGRTTTHEIGHWLGLFHIWGDDTDSDDECAGDDEIDDTPNQATEYYGCPDYPQNSCGSNDMFMNYMDYVNDDCMHMFTKDQCTQMGNIIQAFRFDILESAACDTPTVHDAGISHISEPDILYIKDTLQPHIRLTNYGKNELDSVMVYYGRSNKTDSLQWTGFLPSGRSTEIILPEIIFQEASVTFFAYTRLPDGNVDDEPNNDTSRIVTTKSVNNITFHLQTDSFAHETAIVVNNTEGDVLYVSNGYINNNFSSEVIPLGGNGCYKLVVNDEAGDGICCNFGEGYYYITSTQGDTLVYNNGTFGSESSNTLCYADSVDAGITNSEFSITDPCENMGRIKYEFTNHSPQEINQLSFQVFIPELLNDTVNWTGSLAQYEKDSIIIDIEIPYGLHDLAASILSVNTQNDQLLVNNDAYDEIDMDIYSLFLQIQPDIYASEISWLIRNSNSQIVARGGPYSDDNLDLITSKINLQDDCYTFIMTDDYGDGLLAGAYFGGYDVFGNELFFSTGDYDTTQVHYFCINNVECLSQPSAVTNEYDSPEIYPNPAQDAFYINLPQHKNQSWSARIYTIDGNLIRQLQLREKTRIDLTGQPKGIYLVRISNHHNTYARKLILH